MKTLTKMPITQFSGLDYDNVIRDIYNLVKDNPEYNSNWDDFLSSSAGRMLIELFAYITDQLATRIDWNVNENYLTTATQTKSILRLLKLIDYKLQLPHSSIIPVKITLSQSTNKEIIFTPAYTELSGTRTNIYTINGTDKNGNIRTYEAVAYDSINDKFLYKNKVSANANTTTYNSVFTLNFHEGTTKVSQFISSTSDNQKFDLPDTSVINNSITIYTKRTVNGELTEVELLKVNNFLENEAQDGTLEIPYVVNVLENGAIQIEFAPKILMKDERKLLPVGSNLYVFYRVGGGAIGNLQTKAINFDRKIYTIDGDAIDANFINEESGYGGTELETIDHAALYGPLSLRSVNKTVTIEDYAAILAKNQLVLKSVSYGCNNMPDNFYNKYGVYINPQEVWNFILLNKNYEGIPPSEFKNFKWMDSRLENRFNELYGFNNSKFNNVGYYSSILGQELFLNYKTGTSKTFYNYTTLNTPSIFKENLGSLDNAGDLILNPYFKFKATKLETSKLFFDSIGSITDTTENFIDSAVNTFGMIDGSLVDYAEEETASMFISPVHVENSSSDSNNVYGFDISTKYNIGIDIDGRGMIIIPLNDDYAINDNKKIFLSNPNPLIKPTGGGYYNTLYEARYHKGIVEKINTALANDTTTYGSNARPTQLLGLSLDYNNNNPQAQAFSEITSETSIPITINGSIYTISYGGVGRTSQYYNDIVGYINTDLVGFGFTCELYTMANGFKDIRFTSLIDNTISVEKTLSNPNADLLYYLYNDLTAVPLTASNGGNYSNVASVLTDSSGAKYLKIVSPSTGIYSSIQFKVSDFKNDLNNSTEFMDKLGVAFIGNVSAKVIGKRTLTLVSNYNNSLYGNLIFETNILGKDPAESKVIYLHYTGSEKNSIVLGSVYNNFYSSDPETFLSLNKVNYVYNTVLNDNNEVIMNDSNFQVAFTKTPITTNSISNAETESNKIYIFPYDFIKLKTVDLSLINIGYFTSDDVLKFSIDGGSLMTIPLGSIYTKLDFISALSYSFLDNGYGSYLEYIEYDYDDPDIIYIKNKKRNLDGNIYFPQVADNNLFFQKIFGTPAENGLKTFYWQEIINHPLGAQYVELTNHPYIDSDYSAVGGFYDSIMFDSRIKDESYPGTYRTPDFYYSYDETYKELSMIKVNGNLIPDTEFYIHFVNDKRYKLDENNNIIITEDEQIKTYLDRYKISSLENKILPANFITFDIEATVTCGSAYSLDSIKYGLEQKLRTAFSVENRTFYEPVIKSKIFAEIQNYSGVLYAEITFLGKDYTDSNTNVANKIDVDFDTIAVLSEDIFDQSGSKKHGLLFNYVQSAV